MIDEDLVVKVVEEIKACPDATTRDRKFAVEVEKLLYEYREWKEARPKIMSAVKPGWKMPQPDCPECGVALIPTACNDGGGEMSFGWECLDGCGEQYSCDDDSVPDIDWPFVGAYAMSQDFTLVGFTLM